MIRYRTKEIKILFFISLFMSFIEYSCNYGCPTPSFVKKDLMQYEKLAAEILKREELLRQDHLISYPYIINCNVDYYQDRIVEDYEEIVAYCQSLNILAISVNENKDVFLILENQSSFFKGETVEAFIEIRYKNKDSWPKIEFEGSEKTLLCEVILSDHIRYVKTKAMN